MKRSLVPLACTLVLSLHAACSSDPAPADTGGNEGQDAAVGADARTDQPDGGVGDDATTVHPDATTTHPDATPGDTGGMQLLPQMDPGSYVQVAEGRVEIGDSFATVKQKLGAGQRSAAMNARSYEWSLSSQTQLTIWFANTNLDDDDAAPSDVDDSDLVLWIAVNGGFTGQTSRGIGIGSTRAQVEAGAPAGYGAAPHTVNIDSPPGLLGQYFTTGFLVAYDQSNQVRTFTVCRAYPHAPDATIDTHSGRLDFGAAGRLSGTLSVQQLGSRLSEVTTLLGTPDAEGEVSIAGQSLKLVSYGFLGIEVFTTITPGLERTLFMSVHAPFYGPINAGTGLGASRMATESAISLGGGMASPMNANFICYEGGGEPDVAVTYSSDANPVATSITVPLIRSQGSTTCP